MKSLGPTFRFISSHPLTRDHKWAAYLRFIKWQIRSRISSRPVAHPFVENTRLIIHGGMTGATGNIYTGLHEFEDMMFLLHLLRQQDIFVDVGANIGSYTVLASSVVGAHTISFEPVPSTFRHLKNNVLANKAELLVELHNAGVGDQKGILKFTSREDTTNHVVTDAENTGNDIIEVDIVNLDEILDKRVPTLIKIDTEGFELSVLRGAISVLKNTGLLALIIELNGACHRYGVNETEIHEMILGFGFIPVSYEPFERRYTKMKSFNPGGNTIYIKNEDEVAKRIESARKIKVLNQCV